ncbi:MAG TPA: Flp pilus assembly protein CpaB [Symbiobacteriaceae bacterium]|nr:Flp pilus assembly protein CpaB [Symbiobacteriaceae bacterium]
MKQRSGGSLLLVISLIAGLVAAFLTVSVVRGATRLTSVIVATQEIQPYTAITAEMLTVKQLPASAVSADAIKDPAALVGRYTRSLVLPDAVLRTGYLATAAGNSGSVAAKLSETNVPGARAMAIAVDNATAVGGTLQVGDKVDVIAAVKVERQGAPTTTVSKVIAKGIPVLYTTPADTAAKATVVVQVTPSMAEEIAYAQTAGTVYLATNPYQTELTPIQTSGVTPDIFYQRYSPTR